MGLGFSGAGGEEETSLLVFALLVMLKKYIAKNISMPCKIDRLSPFSEVGKTGTSRDTNTKKQNHMGS